MEALCVNGGALGADPVRVAVKEEEQDGENSYPIRSLSVFLKLKKEEVENDPEPNASDVLTLKEDPDISEPVIERSKKENGKKKKLERKEWVSMEPEGEDSLWHCKLCQRCFSSSWELTGHCCMGIIGDGEEGTDDYTSKLEFRCPVCGDRFFRPTAFIMHKRSHVSQSRYLCGVCGRTLKTLRKLAFHRQAHSRAGLWQHHCQKCSRKFSNHNALKKHQESQHGEEWSCMDREEKMKDGEEKGRGTTSPPKDSRGKLAQVLQSPQCLQCFMTFQDVETAERHLRFKHPAEYEQQLQGHTVFACCVCDHTFPSSRLLSAHQRTHSKWSMTSSSSEHLMLGKTDTEEVLRDRSLDCVTTVQRSGDAQTVQNNYSSMSCLHCHIIFADPRTWERHMNTKHPSSPPAGVGNSSKEMFHRPSEGQERPYHCCTCGERFIRESSLTKHCSETHSK
ncbi:zinc finger protein 771-like [Chanos chanos]|uniref:Zinc finger protein 771-like n=1 Tax=Chanos chanos TaxID=29144 RepID=A0A6J2WBE9_CHACN|nr:zinc finger protein 771-like [Chanos chanos]